MCRDRWEEKEGRVEKSRKRELYDKKIKERLERRGEKGGIGEERGGRRSRRGEKKKNKGKGK